MQVLAAQPWRKTILWANQLTNTNSPHDAAQIETSIPPFRILAQAPRINTGRYMGGDFNIVVASKMGICVRQSELILISNESSAPFMHGHMQQSSKAPSSKSKQRPKLTLPNYLAPLKILTGLCEIRDVNQVSQRIVHGCMGQMIPYHMSQLPHVAWAS